MYMIEFQFASQKTTKRLSSFKNVTNKTPDKVKGKKKQKRMMDKKKKGGAGGERHGRGSGDLCFRMETIEFLIAIHCGEHC